MQQSDDIRVLPAVVINKIAAGEVVDRPASVLKELMENAVDAGAVSINVEVSSGGLKLISVSDDGRGMARDNALLSIERHATSKIRDVNDIEQIATMGFRGEALAAISSVSRFRMVTRAGQDIAGTELVMTGGRIMDVRDAGCPRGTLVEVRDLFFNVPARRKFVRSEQTELSHIKDVFLTSALANNTLGMTLKIDGRETYRLAGKGSLKDRLADIYGPDYVRNLAPVAFSSAGITCSGFAGIPSHEGRGRRSDQYFFVNGRPVGAALIAYSVKEAYRALVANDRMPPVFIFISIAPGQVDVNVHPTKKEVRFRQAGVVRDCLISAIRGALGSGPRSSLLARPFPEGDVTSSQRQPGHAPAQVPLPGNFGYPAGGLFPVSVTARDPVSRDMPQGEPAAGQAPGRTAPWRSHRILGQAGELYVLIETEDGIVLMDPHAAHERVLFEKYMSEITSGSVRSQALLLPETVELGPRDALLVRRNIEVLARLGVGISEFGGDSFVVDSMPACFSGLAPSAFLVEAAAMLEQGGARGGHERWREESVAQAACKAAVKAHDRLDAREMEQLVVDLAAAEMPYTCPHGRPTLILMSYGELARKFGRT